MANINQNLPQDRLLYYFINNILVDDNPNIGTDVGELNNLASAGGAGANTMLSPLYIFNPNNEVKEDEINSIIENSLSECFNFYDDELQIRIKDQDLYTRSDRFDDFESPNMNTTSLQILQQSIVRYIVVNGLRNGYTPTTLIANIFAYFFITYPDYNVEDLKNIIQTIAIPIIRRNDFRQNVFSNIFMQFINNVEDQFDDNDQSANYENNGPLTDQKFERLNCAKFMKFTNIDNKCSICNDIYLEDDDVVELNCSYWRKTNDSKSIPNHYFHKDCIYEWTTKHRGSCPLCRTIIDI
jgi:hypothetical protein